MVLCERTEWNSCDEEGSVFELYARPVGVVTNFLSAVKRGNGWVGRESDELALVDTWITTPRKYAATEALGEHELASYFERGAKLHNADFHRFYYNHVASLLSAGETTIKKLGVENQTTGAKLGTPIYIRVYHFIRMAANHGEEK